MMKRILSLLLVVGLIAVLAVPVSAVEGNSGGWIEFLETTSVQSNGENWFTLNGQTGSFTLPLHTEKRLVSVDMLIWHQSAERITKATVTAAGSTFSLSIVFLGNGISRIYGDIPNAYYEKITVNLTHNTTSSVTYELLSFKATPMAKVDYDAQGYLYVDNDYNNKLTLPNNYRIDGDEVNMTSAWITRIEITDWRKYDYVTFYGSISGVGLNAVRASVGTKGLPFTITYCQSNPAAVGGSFQGFTSENHYDSTNSSYGKINGDNLQYYNYRAALLYTITVDLTGLDRTDVNNLMLYFTGVVNSSEGHYFNCQFATGTVLTADTSSVSWWNRFTAFMTDLFGREDPGALDDLGSSSDSISQNTSQIHDFEQSQQAVLDNNMSQIQSTVDFTNFASALVFVQTYTNMAVFAISDYVIVFTLPMFLGLFFYFCSRVPGITRCKSPPPGSKQKVGGKQ